MKRKSRWLVWKGRIIHWVGTVIDTAAPIRRFKRFCHILSHNPFSQPPHLTLTEYPEDTWYPTIRCTCGKEW